MIINSWGLKGSKNSAGGLTVSTRLGVTVARQKPQSVRNPRTIAQRIQRNRASGVTSIAKEMTAYARKYFKPRKAGVTKYNELVYALNKVVVGELEGCSINTGGVGIISNGEALDYSGLSQAYNPTTNVLTVTWADSEILPEYPLAKATLVAIGSDGTGNTYVVIADETTDVLNEIATITFSNIPNGVLMRTHITWYDPDSRKFGQSKYVGQTTVS